MIISFNLAFHVIVVRGFAFSVVLSFSLVKSCLSLSKLSSFCSEALASASLVMTSLVFPSKIFSRAIFSSGILKDGNVSAE